MFDEDLKPVPIGKEGELIAFGDGLALGYLNRPDLTAERFVKLQKANGEIGLGYRTGDIVSQSENGYFEYFGRKDQQVKIDGKRIEMGEIEHVLKAGANIS